MVRTVAAQHSKDVEERISLCLVPLPSASCWVQGTPNQWPAGCPPPSQLPPCPLPCFPSSLATSVHLLLHPGDGRDLLWLDTAEESPILSTA